MVTIPTKTASQSYCDMSTHSHPQSQTLNLMWLEEPIPAENVESYKLITGSTSTPICASENHYLAYGFRRMLVIGAVDIVMPDLQKCGGLGEGQRIANLANLYYVPFAPHIAASFLGAMACAHVCIRTQLHDHGRQSYFHYRSYV
jgi:galactonate dehydratase